MAKSSLKMMMSKQKILKVPNHTVSPAKKDIVSIFYETNVKDLQSP